MCDIITVVFNFIIIFRYIPIAYIVFICALADIWQNHYIFLQKHCKMIGFNRLITNESKYVQVSNICSGHRVANRVCSALAPYSDHCFVWCSKPGVCMVFNTIIYHATRTLNYSWIADNGFGRCSVDWTWRPKFLVWDCFISCFSPVPGLITRTV